ncbi:aminotransferase class V-fold PLP-dependent enzyme, partial [Candidatus Gracilibacteria bacterium]|nr:aminotransferase class V-fold PLP-dependent enzyme [Candidatus Gracilibacteria bacterium]
DGYQAAGQLPVDVQASDVDFYLTGGLKWMLGGPGIVYLYTREELATQLLPTTAGWFGHREQFAFDAEHFAFHDDARRFEVGTPAVAAVYAGRAGMDIVLEIGAEAIRERQMALTADMVAKLYDAGLSLKIPADLREHAGIVMVQADDPAATVRALRERNIIADYRPGYVRLSPYFYTTEDENTLVAQALRPD